MFLKFPKAQDGISEGLGERKFDLVRGSWAIVGPTWDQDRYKTAILEPRCLFLRDVSRGLSVLKHNKGGRWHRTPELYPQTPRGSSPSRAPQQRQHWTASSPVSVIYMHIRMCMAVTAEKMYVALSLVEPSPFSAHGCLTNVQKPHGTLADRVSKAKVCCCWCWGQGEEGSDGGGIGT
jgi:hypothetical protein